MAKYRCIDAWSNEELIIEATEYNSDSGERRLKDIKIIKDEHGDLPSRITKNVTMPVQGGLWKWEKI